MYDYCYSKLNDISSSKDYYSNKKLLENLDNNKYKEKILKQYQIYFTEVISFIDSILDKLLVNFNLFPYTIKCFCKIISELIIRKFPSINETEKNAFIAIFFFGKLLIPILMNPEIEVFINNFFISKNTLHNLKIICDIINKFTSGKFYISEKNSDYTPFNIYFIEKMEKLFNIFDNITKVQLPSFIDKLINNELPNEFKYDYFTENPDEIIYHHSACFNLIQIKELLSIMDKNKGQIFKEGEKYKNNHKLKATMDKLLSRINKYNEKESINVEKMKLLKINI